jgi:hypothetical protein
MVSTLPYEISGSGKSTKVTVTHFETADYLRLLQEIRTIFSRKRYRLSTRAPKRMDIRTC